MPKARRVASFDHAIWPIVLSLSTAATWRQSVPSSFMTHTVLLCGNA